MASILFYALFIQKAHRLLMARITNRDLLRFERLAGAFPGLLNGMIASGVVLGSLLMIPVSSPLKDVVTESRLARPLALWAWQMGKPFGALAQEAALEARDFITQRFGEPSISLSLPVTELTVDTAAEKRMLELVNAERTQRGLQPLVLDEKLTQIARQHSEEMLKQHYFAHDSPALGSPFDRMKRAGIPFRTAGENSNSPFRFLQRAEVG